MKETEFTRSYSWELKLRGMDKCGTEIYSFGAVLFFLLPAFKNQELSVNIQIPSLSENTQKLS